MVNKVFIIATSFLVLHLILAGFFELIDDEAYYNFWSTSISLGYYDHPPMVAWWIYLGKFIFGSTTLGVRFFSVLSFFFVSLLVGRIAFLVSGNKNVVLSVLLFNITMPIMGLGFISTPDAPLLLFWTSALWAILEGLYRNNSWFLLLVGVFLALSVMSKYNALFFILGLFVWCVSTREGRETLRSPFIWLGAFLGGVLLSPHLLWNYKNSWLGLEKQFSRLLNETTGFSFFYEFLISIIIFSTPLLCFFAIAGLFKPHKYRKLLLWIYLPSLIYFLNHSFTERIQGNWIIIFFPWLAIMAAVGLQHAHALWRKLTIFTGLFFSISILFLGLSPQYVIFSGDNPFNQMKGWQSVENKLLSHMDSANWVAVSEYSMIGRLTWLSGSSKKIWAINEPMRYHFRSEFPSDLCSTPGILIEKFYGGEDKTELVDSGKDPDVYLDRNIGDTKLMSYKIRNFSKLIESPYC